MFYFPQLFANEFPKTVTDIMNRKVLIRKKPEKVAFMNARGVNVLDIMYGDDAGKHIVAWGNDMVIAANDMYQYYVKKYPNLKNIPKLGKIYDGSFNVESFLNLKDKPDIFFVDAYNANLGLKTHVVQIIQKYGIPVIFYDFRKLPVPNTTKSVEIIGQSLGKTKEARKYITLYKNHLNFILNTIKNSKQQSVKKVFIEREVGHYSQQLKTFGNIDMGSIIKLLSATNIMEKPLHGAGFGITTPENLIKYQPDIYIMTSSAWNDKNGNPKGNGVRLGYPPYKIDKAQKENQRLLDRVWMNALKAKKNKSIHTIWQVIHNSPYNIVTIEYFAKWIYPELFKNLNPHQTYSEINKLSNVHMITPLVSIK